MNSILRLARLTGLQTSSPLREFHLSAAKCMADRSVKVMKNFNPNNYSVPLRPVTMDDAMEPYGSWKVAYEKERVRSNKILIAGIVAFSASCAIFYHSGVMDALFMPNLDNIMEDTVPFEFEKEGRKTV